MAVKKIRHQFMNELAQEFISGNNEDVVDIITFVESPWGLNFKLFPVQRFILKSFYGMHLDNINKVINVPDEINERILYNFTELEFLKFLAEEGRCNTDFIEDKNFNELVLVLGRRAGKCRSINDIISTTIGSITFNELLFRKNNGENIGIFTYDDNFKRKITHDFKIWDNGEKECYELLTQTGIKEISSGNHPYLVWKDDSEKYEFCNLSELKPGYRIAVSKKQDLFGNCNDVNKAKLFGYILGNGSFNFSNDISSSILIDYENVINEYLSLYSKNDCEIINCVNNKNIDEYLIKSLFKNDCESENDFYKNIPDFIMRGTKEVVAKFLNRLFSIGGNISVKLKCDINNDFNTGNIVYRSIHKDLVDGIRHLLLKFGIHSKVIKDDFYNNINSYEWKIVISSKIDVYNFINEIGIYLQDNMLSNLLDSYEYIYDVRNIDSVPIGVLNYIFKIKEERNLYNQQIFGYDFDHTCFCEQEFLTKNNISLYGKNIDDEFLNILSEQDVVWDVVDSINKCGIHKTVDLEVNNTHIIGGDIISHNSSIASCISCYELYKLVKRGDPSKYYGLAPDTPICITNVAPTDSQAGVVFEMIQSKALSCPYLRDRSINQTLTYFNLQTDVDIASSSKRKKASLTSLAGGCASNSLRGRNNIVIIMDEMAFFIDNNGRFSGSEVYKALKPSIASFKGDGKVICISSPYAKYGKFYDLYNESYHNQDNVLMFQMPSTMVNSTINSNFLKSERKRDPIYFLTEYCGEFSDKVTAWVDDEDNFNKCINLEKQSSLRGETGVDYYMGIDLGLKNDGTGIVICHKEKQSIKNDNMPPKIVIDYATVYFSGSSDIWDIENSIYSSCTKYSGYEIIPLTMIVEDIVELCKWYHIRSGWFDHYNGYALYQHLTDSGLKQFHMEHVTDILNDNMYNVWKNLYGNQLIEFPNDNILISEILQLEAERKSKAKVSVRAPNKRGAHDDIADACARAIWEAYNYTKGGSNTSTGNSCGSIRGSMNAHVNKQIRNHGINIRNINNRKIRSRYY